MFRDRLTLAARKTVQSRIASPVIIKAHPNRLPEVVETIRPFVERVHERYLSGLFLMPTIIEPEITPFTPYPMRILHRFNMVASLLPREVIYALADGPYVEKIYHDQTMYAFAFPMVPDEGIFHAPHRILKEIQFTSTYWTRRLMGADLANEKGFYGDGILVSIADTGASRVHEMIRRVQFETTMKEYRDECYDPNTDILSLDGWKPISEVAYSDKLATLNPFGYMEYHYPLDVQTLKYRGKMIKINGKFCDLLVTPRHSLYCKYFNTKRFKPIMAKKYLGRYHRNVQFKRNTEWEGQDVPYFTPPKVSGSERFGTFQPKNLENIPINLWLRFFGWWLTEGSLKYDGRFAYTAFIYQYEIHNENRDEIAHTLDQLGIKYYESDKAYSFRSKQLYQYLSQFGKSREKWIPIWIKNLPSYRLQILLDTMVKGDGWKDQRANTRYFSTSSYRLANDIQEIAMKAGYSSSLSKREHEWHDYNYTMYKVSISEHCFTPCVCDSPELIDYDGLVYDVTVPNHIILVRRNGMPIWSGNCGHGTWCTSAIGGVRMRDDYLSQRARKEVLCEGMAPRCDLLAVKCLGYFIGAGSTSHIIDAIDISLTRKAKIISMSLGGDVETENPQDDPYYTVLEEMVKEGAIPVVAAGNNGPGSGTVSTPGAMPQCLTVGAYDPVRGNIADYSSRGPVWGMIKPDCIAPGSNIDNATVGVLDTSGDGVPSRYSPLSGTSMATPAVAGLIALMCECKRKTVGKDLSVDEVKAMLQALGHEKSNQDGWGKIDWNMWTYWLESQYGVKL